MTTQKITDLPDDRLALAIAKSGYFEDARESAQALVKVLAGREIGLGPIASMTGVYLVKGRVAFGANLMAAALKRGGRYNYRVIEHTDEACEIEFFEIEDGKRESIGRSRFTREDAGRAGTRNMDKFPRNMLFARAMSNGVRWYAPDVFAGAPVYTPEELGANTNEDGEVIDASPLPTEAPEAKPVAVRDVHAEFRAGLQRIGATPGDVRAALGEIRPSEWLAANDNNVDALLTLIEGVRKQTNNQS